MPPIPKFIAPTRQDITAICSHNGSGRALPVRFSNALEAPTTAMRGGDSPPDLRPLNAF